MVVRGATIVFRVFRQCFVFLFDFLIVIQHGNTVSSVSFKIMTTYEKELLNALLFAFFSALLYK